MKRLAGTAAALAVAAAGLVGVAGPASAVTAHCPGHNSPDKVELDRETTTISLPAGTTVCYKAGTTVVTTVVGASGVLTSTVRNKRGRVMAISYYVVTEDCPPHTGS